jgi:hypothetical protein
MSSVAEADDGCRRAYAPLHARSIEAPQFAGYLEKTDREIPVVRLMREGQP